jgi:hypothetical protein
VEEGNVEFWVVIRVRDNMTLSEKEEYGGTVSERERETGSRYQEDVKREREAKSLSTGFRWCFFT